MQGSSLQGPPQHNIYAMDNLLQGLVIMQPNYASPLHCHAYCYSWAPPTLLICNPLHTCAARVTALGLSVCHPQFWHCRLFRGKSAIPAASALQGHVKRLRSRHNAAFLPLPGAKAFSSCFRLNGDGGLFISCSLFFQYLLKHLAALLPYAGSTY